MFKKIIWTDIALMLSLAVSVRCVTDLIDGNEVFKGMLCFLIGYFGCIGFGLKKNMYKK